MQPNGPIGPASAATCNVKRRASTLCSAGKCRQWESTSQSTDTEYRNDQISRKINQWYLEMLVHDHPRSAIYTVESTNSLLTPLSFFFRDKRKLFKRNPQNTHGYPEAHKHKIIREIHVFPKGKVAGKKMGEKMAKI